VNSFLRTDEALDFFNKICRGNFEGVEHAFGLLRQFHRLKRLFLPDLRGRGKMRRPEIFFTRIGVRSGVFRRSMRRQSGRHVFGAFDFMRVMFSKTRSMPPCSLTTSARA